MLIIDMLAEEQILAAMRRGDFDGLQGQGEPLKLDDDGAIPQELRVAYRILGNAGCMPPELTLRKEIHAVESLLDLDTSGNEQQKIRRRLDLLKARLAMYGHELNLLVHEQAYRNKVIHSLARTGKEKANGQKKL